VLAKKNRFHGRNTINRVYQKGDTLRGQLCAAKYLTNKTNTYRVAVVVSKKVAKSAPKRNRIRRRIYEAVRIHAPKHLKNHDVVITVFDERLADIPHAEFEQIVIKLLEQINSDIQ
jgi:ribonuclease P protein component